MMAGFVPELLPVKYDLEFLALLAAVTSAAGSTQQRKYAYRRLRPHAGLRVVVGGCASYSGAVDHHLGILAAALGRTGEAAEHLRVAVAMHDRLGATPWAQLSRAAELDTELAQAQDWQDLARRERAAVEHDALIRELTAAAGLGGRTRRLVDETERARKTVTARIRDALNMIDRELPTEPTSWQLTASSGLSGVIRGEKAR